jgi:isochorismate synthase
LELRIEANIGINVKELIALIAGKELPFAVWREPLRKEIHLIVSSNPEPDYRKVDLEDLPPGFVMAPYDYDHSGKSVFIEADSFFSFHSLEESVSEEQLARLGLGSLDKVSVAKSKAIFSNPDLKELLTSTQNELTEFESLVEVAKEKIQAGEFQKVVPSRKKTIQIPEGFDVVSHFNKLCTTYPAVFCFLTYLPWENCYWVGATPEILVQQDENGIFRTMALAGTQSAFNEKGDEISVGEALWRQKEIEEQALVCRFIINSFKKIRVREYTEIGPRTIKAGNLLHLQTTFEVDTASINFVQMAGVMLDLLHPTSAVCGMPKAPAADFLRKHEKYNREFYSGFLGPVNISKQSKLFVNLRSMQVRGTEINLFAGCGITADSIAFKEWNETEMKLRTVLA